MPNGRAFSTKQRSFSTKWLNNAMKSVGFSTQSVLKDIAPNIYEVTSSGLKTSKNIASSISRNKDNVNGITNTLMSNKYVQYARKAYKNAMSDIKTGNFNNVKREEEALMDSFGFDDMSEGFSFGDEPSNVNINVNQGASGDALFSIQNQLQKQTEAQLKTQKANMDAYIAVSSASMQQMGQIGAEIIGRLSNIDSNIAALVQYNNENMSKFIEASLAYYENMGVGRQGNASMNNQRLRATDVFNSGRGGINISQYKNYVKQQFKDNPNISMIGDILKDDQAMNMLVSNPLGFLSKGLVSYMIPKVLKTSLESMEATFSNLSVNILSELGDWADEQGADFASQVKRFMGSTFGLKGPDKRKSLSGAQVNRAAIPFDGETKHAITEIITKELRDQTGYLEIIAEHFKKDKSRSARDIARSKGEYWDYNTSTYVKRSDIDKRITEELSEAITTAFKSKEFGKALENYAERNIKGSKVKKDDVDKFITEFYSKIEKMDSSVDFNTLLGIIQNSNYSGNMKEFMKNNIVHMSRNNPNALNSVNVARLSSRSAAERKKEEILNDPTAYNLFSSSYAMADSDIDEIMAKQLGFKGSSKPKKKSGSSTQTSEKGPSFANKVMSAIFTGNFSKAMSEGMNFLQNKLEMIGNKISTTLFGEKGVEGFKSGGIFSGVSNGFKDIVNSIKYKITGKGYKDSQGNTYADSDESLFGAFASVGKSIKTGFKETFKAGVDGWMDALFGTAETKEEKEKRREDLQKEFKSRLGDAGKGIAIGGGIGTLSGGLLGNLIGGPFVGAGIGAVSGFIAKNKNFQNWLFGEEDEEGNRMGGFISKDVQDYVKENKGSLFTGATIGAVTGAGAGGILGTLVGGPLAGAIMGMAGSIVLKSEGFKTFLFGDEEKGQKGLIKGVKEAFSKGFSDAGGTGEAGQEGMKILGMAGIGAGAGGLLGLMVGGPVLGALGGLALSIKANSKDFKEFLFGKEDGLTLENGKKVKKQGVLGQFGNMLNANILQPLKTEFKFIAKDFMSTMQHKVLMPFSYAAEIVSGQVGKIAGSISSGVKGAFTSIAGSLSSGFKSAIAPVTDIVGKTVEKASDMTWGMMKRVISAPGNFLKSFLEVTGIAKKANDLFIKPVRDLIADVRHLVFSGIGKLFGVMFSATRDLFKGIFGVATAPFKLLGKGIGGLAKKAGDALFGKDRVSGLMEKVRERMNYYDENGDSLLGRWRRNDRDYRQEQAAIRAERENDRRHVKNGKLIAKLTKGQFSEDTDDAREWIRMHNKRAYNKLKASGTSLTEDRAARSEAARIEKEGQGSAGMSNQQLAKADDKKLSEGAKTNKFLMNISDMMKSILGLIEVDKNGFDISGNKVEKKSSESDDSYDEETKPLSKKELNNRLFGRTRQNISKLAGTKFGRKIKNLAERGLAHFAKGGTSKGGPAIINENSDTGAEMVMTNAGDKIIPSGFALTVQANHPLPVYLQDISNKAEDKLEPGMSGLKGKSKSSLDAAIDKGKTAEEQKAEKDAEESKKQEAELVDNSKEATEDAKKHYSAWDAVFGMKKGIITVGLLTLGGLLLKNLPVIVDMLKGLGPMLGNVFSLLKDVAAGVGKALGDTVKDVVWTETHDARTNGNNIFEEAGRKAKDLTDGNPILDENGNITNTSTPVAKFGLRTLLNFKNRNFHMPFESKAAKGQKKFFKGVEAVGNGVKGAFNAVDTKLGSMTKSGKAAAKAAASQADDAVELMFAAQNGTLSTGPKKLSTQVGEKLSGGFKNLASKGMDKIKTQAGKNNGLLSKVCGYIDEFFEFITKKFAQKSGKSAGVVANVLKNIKSKTLDVVKSKIDDIAAKIASVLGIKGGAAAVTAGLSEAVFVTLGAIEGASGTAKLFHVDKSAVDGKMTLISSIFGAISSTTAGSIIDIVAQLVYAVTGTDLMSTIATFLYGLISSDEDKAKLDDAKTAFKSAYDDYQAATISEQFETQKAAGLIDPNMTEDEFRAGVEEGKYNVGYDSFADWNTKKNASFGDKIMSGLGSAGRGIKNFFAGKEQYTDSNGNTYTKNKDGLYDVVTADGKTGVVSKDVIPTDAKKGHTKSGIGGLFQKGTNFIKNKWNSSTGAEKVGSAIGAVAGTVLGPAGTAAGAAIGNKIGSGIDWLMGKSKEVIYRAADGSYYNKDGVHFNSNGDEMDTITPEQLKTMISSGMLSEDKIVTQGESPVKTKLVELKNFAKDTWNKGLEGAKKLWSKIANPQGAGTVIGGVLGGAAGAAVGNRIGKALMDKKTEVWYDSKGSYYVLKDDKKAYNYCSPNGDVIKEVELSEVEEMKSTGLLTKGEIVEDSEAKKAIKQIKEATKEAWKKAKDVVKDKWEKFKNWIGGSDAETSDKPGGGRGGYGDRLNGGTYFSQNDKRWGNNSYGMIGDNASFGQAGCGPTAMAMAMSDVTGRKVSPAMMGTFAQATGNRDETGTNWNFIGDASTAMGVSSQQQLNPSAADISAQLDSGNPVVLSGTSGGGYGSGSPYTNAGHYVVAVGKDNNGNIIVNDPRGPQYSGKYNLNTVASQTGSSWSFGGMGKGRRRKRGGFGTLDDYAYQKTTNAGLGAQARQKWLSVVLAVKKAYADQQPEYNQSGYISITIDGKTISKCRTDCSGMVSACLQFYGVLNDTDIMNSTMFTQKNNSNMLNAGFSSYDWPGWDGLEEGDIISRNGHVEIFARNEGNSHMVYNAGSTKALCSPGATYTGHKDGYTTVWKPGPPGSGCVNGTDVSSSGGSTSGGSTSSDSSSGGGIWDKVKSAFGNFFSAAAGKIMSGQMSSPVTVDEILNGISSDSGSSYSGGSYSSGSYNPATIEGNDTEKSVWKYFTDNGYSKQATAAILGNMKQESGVNPASIQKGSGNAAGIVQWENYKNKNGRWKNMADYAASKGKEWTDLASQLEFIDKELRDPSCTFWTKGKGLTDAGATPTSFDEWKKSTDIEMATRQFEGAFERAGKPAMDNRISAALGYYDKFANETNRPAIDYATDPRYTAPKTSSNTNSTGVAIDYATDPRYKAQTTKSTSTVTTPVSTSAAASQTTPTNSSNNAPASSYLTGGGYGNASISKTKRGRMKSASRIMPQGGRGTVNYGSSSSIQSRAATNRFTSAGNAERYIKTTEDSNINALVMNAVEILSIIAGNTGDTSSKLDALNNLQSLGKGNTIITPGSNNNTIMPMISSKANSKPSRSDVTAVKIARGGSY